MSQGMQPMSQSLNINSFSTLDPVKVIAIASGKGGVGKTNVSVNLASALANKGQSVMLMDADLGLGNVDVLLGIKPKYNFSHVLHGEKKLEEIIIKGPSDVLIVPASSGMQNMSQLSVTEHAGMIRAFSDLNYDLDVFIIDTAAGISDSVISFCKAASDIIIVLCDEPASLTDAYALIKVLNQNHGVKRFKVVANMVQSVAQGSELFSRLVKVTDRFLCVALELIGSIPADEYLKKAVQKQWVVVNAFPRSRASMAFMRLADAVSNWPVPESIGGHLEFFFERLLPQEKQRISK